MGPCHVSKPGGLCVSSAMTIGEYFSLYTQRLHWGLWWMCTWKTCSVEAINPINAVIHTSVIFFFLFFIFFSSALPAYIDIGQNIFLQCSCPLSSDCDVHANRPGKYFSGDSDVCNFLFLLARSTWHMADCTSVLISGYIICDPNGCRRPEVCAEGYVVAVVTSATLLLELVLLNNLRGKVWAVLRWITHCYIILIAWSKSMPILWCAMFVSQPIAIAKLAFSKYARWLWQSLLFRLLPLSCQETTRVMWYGCPEELLRS